MANANNNKGFSLIELMIVVAIIGILSAIAIPNFQRFQMKSRQSEAKNALAAVYQAQKAFHQEWSQYFADWRDIGYSPEGTMRYNIQSSSAIGQLTPTAASGYMGPSDPGGLGNQMATFFHSGVYCGSGAVVNFSICRMDTDYINAAVNTAANMLGRDANQNNFNATAGSDLDRGRDTNYDLWTMDNSKNLFNNNNDAAD